ncbi:16077_t:CDS:2 [Entrophospora sp. SA101]|nr:16075_t:CDS:2 [Entrophospora sp. SA101]CAJ0634046.1 16077_t:CDS:2 [Entrophospora sp. SA101]CAJ0843049.1 9760_t:CDS:2 [Entrophospora sp. SA101]
MIRTSLSFDNENLAAPNLRWIGLHCNDRARFNISEDTLLTISPDDRKKASDLLGKNYLPNEILEILHTCKKAEIQCLCDKDDDDLLNYLTSKIKHPISWL